MKSNEVLTKDRGDNSISKDMFSINNKVETFIINIKTYRKYLEKNNTSESIDVNLILNLVSNLNKYIGKNTKNLRTLEEKELSEVKKNLEIIYSKIETFKEKNIDTKQIKKLLRDLRESIYNLYLPATRRSMPIIISVKNSINEIIEDGDVFKSKEKIMMIYNNVRELCGKVSSKENIISNIEPAQLNELLGNIDYITKETNKQEIENDIMLRILLFFLGKIREKVTNEIKKREYIKKIISYKPKYSLFNYSSVTKDYTTNGEFIKFIEEIISDIEENKDIIININITYLNEIRAKLNEYEDVLSKLIIENHKNPEISIKYKTPQQHILKCLATLKNEIKKIKNKI
ncbi:MAG: hypothetical protein PHN31_03405 [Candidatus Gracilibacteria bacterium]|nr:hypothetical protein [Candidatus Gracilibacteria bacterium]